MRNAYLCIWFQFIGFCMISRLQAFSISRRRALSPCLLPSPLYKLSPGSRHFYNLQSNDLHRSTLLYRTSLNNALSREVSSKTAAAVQSTKTTTTPYHLVIVESPSKCKTIEKILSEWAKEQSLPYSFKVVSCMGHIRNLPKRKADDETAKTREKSKKNSKFPYQVVGIDLDNEYRPSYIVMPEKRKTVAELKTQASKADRVLLATDPDREGEAMAWHLIEELNLPEEKYQRISFSEITPKAVKKAVQEPVGLNRNLVEAQETRRILDRLAGFTVSPVLWKKIAPGLSAGRVQSVGLALVVERERERLVFESTEYWDVDAQLEVNGMKVTASLHAVNGTVIATSGKDFASRGQTLKPESSHKLHMKENDARELVDILNSDLTEWKAIQVKSSERLKQPSPPYKTSTLQQDANRRLGLPVQQTMRTAQELYEAGLISYMRTDSTQLSEEAEAAIKKTVVDQFGNAYFRDPTTTGKSKKKDSKFAQEAHEAIRPALQPNGGFVSPDMLTGSVSEAGNQLYRLIYQRSLASRMSPLKTNETSVLIEATRHDCDTTAHFRTSGSVVLDPGYMLAYGKSMDETAQELPQLDEGQTLVAKEITPRDHETQPPPRYTEASFVKELEALGVGRPSTYAGIVQILRDRAYVGNPVKDPSRLKKQKVRSGAAISAVRAAGGEEFVGSEGRGPLVPSLSAFVVCSLLEKHCPTYVEPDFTARMEERLDFIASGEGGLKRTSFLDDFYAGENGLAAKIKRLDEFVSPDEARRAELPTLTETDNDVGVFVGPWGPYVQKIVKDGKSDKPPSAPMPPNMAADLSTINQTALSALLTTKQGGGVVLGVHPSDGRKIRLKVGRFGQYLQWGDDGVDGTTTHSFPREKAIPIDLAAENLNVENGLHGFLTLGEAVGYVELPRVVTTLNELPILASIGPYGPYLKYNNTYVALSKAEGDILTIDATTAELLITDAVVNGKRSKSKSLLAELGERDGAMVFVKNGRFGEYLSWKRVNAMLPKNYRENPSKIPLDEAWSLIQAKAGSNISTKKATLKGGKTTVNIPSPPKRPLSAYLHFCAEKRPVVAEKTTSLGEVSKQLAAMWSAASLEERQRFDEMAAKSKTEYEALRKQWEEKYKSEKSRRKSSTASESSKGPSIKKPKSAYLHFCDANRAKVSEKVRSLGEISKELARLWAETDDRSEFEKLAHADKERYAQEMKSLEPQSIQSTTREKSISSTTEHKGEVIATPKRPPSAYMLFCKEYRPQVVNGDSISFGEATKRLAELWRNCDSNTRAHFEALAAAEKQKMSSVQ